ncbi:vacuolar transporter chaperone [Gryganskiella cystojenkinii]|nr:vacuolar transporter chaperone [Gryganskiella cystojenkinii]
MAHNQQHRQQRQERNQWQPPPQLYHQQQQQQQEQLLNDRGLMPSSSTSLYQPPPLPSSFPSSSFPLHYSSPSPPPPSVPHQTRPQFSSQQGSEPQQPQPHPYQPTLITRPQIPAHRFNHQNNSSAHSYQPLEAHHPSSSSHQQPQPQQHQTHTNNNSNFSIPKRESSYPALPSSPSPSSTPYNAQNSTFAYHPLTTHDVQLESPQPHHTTVEPISLNRNPLLSDRPISVASYSNLSTHSYEPLYQRQPSSVESSPLVPGRPLNTQANHSTRNRFKSPTGPSFHKKKSYNKMKSALPTPQHHQYRQQEEEFSSRSITPQPWHPDYAESEGRSTPNRFSRMELLDDPAKSEYNKSNDDHNEKNGLVKTRKGVFSRFRRAKTRAQIEYDIHKTGRFAQFSNERLYLHWLRFGVLQGSIAITLLSFGIGIASYVGVGAFILCVTTLIYSTTLYHTRHLWMITKRKDVLYYEKTIPTLLTLGLVLLYGGNFALTMSFGEDARSPPPWTSTDVHF